MVGVRSLPYSGEDCGSRMIPEVHSVLILETRRLDGRLFLLDSDGLIRSSEGIGVVGGVEKVSPSGDAIAKAEAMKMGWSRLRNVRELFETYLFLAVFASSVIVVILSCLIWSHLLTCTDRLSASNHHQQSP